LFKEGSVAEELKAANPPAKAVDTVTFILDGQSITVPKGTSVLEASLNNNIHVPSFCWHPKLKSVGACRMCYVEIEKMPKLMVSCSTEATNGMVVHTNSDLVKRGRKAVLEFTLINHPLDCPTCDKGGECDLQDLTFAHGYDDSRFEFQKYRFTEEGKQSTFDDLRIGPEIVLNRNRCILCFKCVRANKEAFGEYDLGAYERGNITEINAAPGEQVDNPFSGNLVEICPVGALTNTDWRYKIRVWLTEQVPSICPFTSSGSNILFYKERQQNQIYRVTSRRNDLIDDGWLADVTRYGYQIATSEDRLQSPLIKKNGKQAPATWDEAVTLVAKKFKEIAENKGGVCLGALAAPSLDNAALHSLNKLMRHNFQSNNVDFRGEYRMLPKIGDTVYAALASRPFKIADIDTSDVVVVFGSDLHKEHPNEYLRIRKAKQFNRSRVFFINPLATKAADIADAELIYAVGGDELALNALALAGIELGLSDDGKLKGKLGTANFAETALASGIDAGELKLVAKAIAEGRKITFICGELITRSSARENISAAVCNLNKLFGIENKGQIGVLARHANSAGAARLGLLPELSDNLKSELNNLWGKTPEAPGLSTDAMFSVMKKGELNGYLIVGANPMMLYPDRQFVQDAFKALDFLVVADLYETETTALADVVFPLSSWAEYNGHYVNLEGRVQFAEAAIKPKFESKPAHEIVSLIASKFGRPLFGSASEMQAEITNLLKSATVTAWPNDYLQVTISPESRPLDYPVPLMVGDDPHHVGHLTEKSISLSNFVSEAYMEMSPDLAAKHKISSGDQIRVESETGKIIVKAKISSVLDSDTVFIPRNFSATPVNCLLSRKRRTDWVRLSKVQG